MLNLLLVSKVFAATAIPTDKPVVTFGITTLSGFFYWVTNALIIAGLGLVVVFLAMGFIRFITSQGDKVATEQAQKWVTYAVLGGVGLFAVYAIKAIVFNLMGVSDPTGNY
jgi:hypothetical protein